MTAAETIWEMIDGWLKLILYPSPVRYMHIPILISQFNLIQDLIPPANSCSQT